jgi:hypothetical protein
MSQKRMMSKQQRLYFEQNNKDKIRKELEETVKDMRQIEEKLNSPFDPHRLSYFY